MDFGQYLQYVSSSIIVLAAIAGGLWTLYRFRRLREAKKALRLNIYCRSISTAGGVLLDVTIEPLNTGTVPIYITDTNIDECKVEVWSVAPATVDVEILSGGSHTGAAVDPIKYLLDYREWEEEKDPIILEPSVPCEVTGHALVHLLGTPFVLLKAVLVDSENTRWRSNLFVDTRNTE